jgi:hypothetical protein
METSVIIFKLAAFSKLYRRLKNAKEAAFSVAIIRKIVRMLILYFLE